MKPGKSYLVRFSFSAFVLFILNYILAKLLGVNVGKVSLMVTFLWGVFLSFRYFYLKIKNRPGVGFLVGFLLFKGLKFIIALAGAFLLIDPESAFVKQEALFYLFDYFILLMVDVFLILREINNNRA